MIVRKANFEDTDRILVLYHRQYETKAEQQPYFFREAEQERDFVHEMIRREDIDILLLEEDHVIGFLLVRMDCRPDRPFFVPHRFAQVMDMLVEPFYRGAGWGGMLLDAAKNWAKEREAEYLELDVFSNNVNAISFYERHGFETRKNTMFCRL